MKKRKKEYSVKIDPSKKPVKYLIAKQMGLSKRKAAEFVYGNKWAANNITQIENTKTYKLAAQEYAGFLLNLGQIAREHNKNIKQDSDKGAKNKAIEMALKILGPLREEKVEMEGGNVTIFFRA